jgi:hypothetical protein
MAAAAPTAGEIAAADSSGDTVTDSSKQPATDDQDARNADPLADDEPGR